MKILRLCGRDQQDAHQQHKKRDALTQDRAVGQPIIRGLHVRCDACDERRLIFGRQEWAEGESVSR